jgi:orotidine-5'-phosphate decarboxylase
MLPPRLRRRAREVEDRPDRAAAWAYTELARAVIDAVASYACAVKVQAAFFEALGPPGFEALARALRLARDHGLAAIADAKRGDIGPTSRAYAQGFFGGQEVDADVLPGLGADAVTVNPYFGTDGVEPFLEASDAGGGGVFVLVRTSNPSAAELQDLELAGGEGAPGPLYRRVAALVRRWAEGREGACGYSSVGAVAGATSPGALAQTRELLPRSILLVPGYGAQGASAGEVACAFDARGEGAVVSASRSITFADRSAETLEELAAAAARAAREMRDAVREAVARR